MTLYYSMIQPYITYGLLIWGNTHPSILRKTVLLQKRVIRYIDKSSYNSHTEPLFKKYNILKLYDHYEYEIMLSMHDFANGNLPRSFDNIFKYNRDMLTGYKTRQSNMTQIYRCYSYFSKHLPIYSIWHICNIWSKQIKQNITRTCFKRLV